MSSIANNKQIEEHFVQILAYIRLKGHKKFLRLYSFFEKNTKTWHIDIFDILLL